jgi:hypothetical protein
MKKNLSIFLVLILFSKLSYGDIVIGGTITRDGKYKGRQGSAAGLKMNCSFNPFKDCYRTTCTAGNLVIEVNGPNGWEQIKVVMRRDDGTDISNPTLEEFLARRECGSYYDENGELVTSCFYNNVFIVE